MKKQILAMSVLAALSGCDLDNSDALKVAATFDNSFKTEVGFNGTEGLGFDVQLTTGHGQAAGTLIVNDVNYGEANVDYSQIGVATDPEKEKVRTLESMYGTFTIAPIVEGPKEVEVEGYSEWTYDLDETRTDVAAILDDPAASLTDTITIPTLDGTKKTINFIIQGVDPTLPAEFKGDLKLSASLTSIGDGGLKVYDPNFNESKFEANAISDPLTAELTPTTFDDNGKPVGILSEKGFGSLFISEGGTLEFHVNKFATTNNPEDETEILADLLPEEDSKPVTDSVTVTTAGGTTQKIDITIFGAKPAFVAKVPDLTDEDSYFHINMNPAGITNRQSREGKLTFRAKIDGLTKKASFSVGCHANFHTSEQRRVATFYIQPEGQFEMWAGEIKPGADYFNRATDSTAPYLNPSVTDNAIFDQSFVPGEWHEFTMTWEGAAQLQKPELHLWLDGEKLTSAHGAVPDDPTKPVIGPSLGGKNPSECVNNLMFYIKSDADKGGTGGLLVDDVQYYTNINAIPKTDSSTAELNEDFQNSAGQKVINIEPNGVAVYNTPDGKGNEYATENVVVVRDL